MDVYTKNLENLKRNLWNDNYSIPISYKSEQSNKSKKFEEKVKKINKIKYN